MKKTQTLLKRDTTENWLKAKNFIPKEGEIIVYDDIFPAGIKIGDGETKLNDLPFIGEYKFSINNDILQLGGQ